MEGSSPPIGACPAHLLPHLERHLLTPGRTCSNRSEARVTDSDFASGNESVYLLGSPGPGKPPTGNLVGNQGLPRRPPRPGRRLRQVDTRRAEAHHAGHMPDGVKSLGRHPPLIIDETDYVPFEPEASNVFLKLMSSSHDYASPVPTWNLPFSGWGRVSGDQAVAAAVIGRIVHHAHVLTLNGALSGRMDS